VTSTAPSTGTVVVVAVFHAAPGKLDALRSALVEAIPAVHAEEGCELYAIHDAPTTRSTCSRSGRASSCWTRTAAAKPSPACKS
jgi:hypothetical protein